MAKIERVATVGMLQPRLLRKSEQRGCMYRHDPRCDHGFRGSSRVHESTWPG
jgi:hypothetical protein